MTESTKAKPLLIALKAESESLNFYQRMAKRSTNPTGRQMFEKLMHEEKKHIKGLEKMLRKIKVSADSISIDEKASVLSEIDFADPALSDIEVLASAIEDEKYAVDFYAKQAELCSDEEEKTFFLMLVKDEEAHKQILEREQARLKK